jgi:serine protease AprX
MATTRKPPRYLPLSRALVERVLLGADGGGQRFTQDGPVLPEVWIAYAMTPTQRVALLFTPYDEVPAGQLARDLLGAFGSPAPGSVDVDRKKGRLPSATGAEDAVKGVSKDARVAYLDQLVAANLTYEELLMVAMPLTDWWVMRCREAGRRERDKLDRASLIRSAIGELFDDPRPPWPRIDMPDSVSRFITLIGLLEVSAQFKDIEEMLNHASARGELIDAMVTALLKRNVLADLLHGARGIEHGSAYSISLNRTAFPATSRSIPAIKADAAAFLFKTDCSRLTWAVIDSGIDARHPTFLKEKEFPEQRDEERPSRVRATFDFTRVRDLLWFDRLTSDQERKDLITELTTLSRLPPADVERHVLQIAADVAAARKVNWQSVAELLKRLPDTPPYTDHGTHVASILGGGGWEARKDLKGVCPDIHLYDLRVLARSLEETEFAVIAALQFVRQLNERGTKIIHGANLSLSIPHDVRNYACGRTPVCDEAERLTKSGVTVVAAAGNFGYNEYQTIKGVVPGYSAISITDPGNAQHVITVGATHRFRPHTYGVSFFSSRGPTGDGRVKPDLVAPGEKIEAALPGSDYGTKDGTSMAAPHVSGAAALLMARHSELTDDPEAIKRILMQTATDLGRERYFQGAGMLDVLRAMQKP